MSSLPVLDLVLGMIFIYFLLSIICSSAVELWFTILKTRAKLLEQWLKRIFDSPALDSHGAPIVDKNNTPVSVGQAIMDHCMVTALSGKGRSTSYINAENFFSALMDKITIIPVKGVDTAVQVPPKNLDEYLTAIQNSTTISGELKRTFLMLANEAKQAASMINTIPAGTNITNISSGFKSELEEYRDRMERWYNTNADRLTGTLKRTRAVPATIIIATLITIGLNADSISIGKYLYDHKEETRQFADRAVASLANFEERVQKMSNPTASGRITDSTATAAVESELQAMKKDVAALKATVPKGLPIGWKKGAQDWIIHIPGWLVTILAICIGAPFWFDILNKIANLRSTGPKPASGKDDGKN